jgi:hypothetical protein
LRFLERRIHIGLATNRLPHLNGLRRSPFHSYYSDRTKRIVATIYRRDFELFKYRI